METVAGDDAPERIRRGGREWSLVSGSLSPDWPAGGFRVVAVPLGVVTAPFERISGALRITGILAILGALVAALFLSRGLARPVRKLVAAASRIGGGDYDARVELGSRDDEIGRAAQADDELKQRILAQVKGERAERQAEGD
jgi:HAMP domain-containing protein